MGWRRCWLGRGPFNNLSPWERPGWLFGRGLCSWMYDPNLQKIAPLEPYVANSKDQEIFSLESRAKLLEQTLNDVKKRLEELEK